MPIYRHRLTVQLTLVRSAAKVRNPPLMPGVTSGPELPTIDRS